MKFVGQNASRTSVVREDPPTGKLDGGIFY